MTTIQPEFIHRFIPGAPDEPTTLLLLHGTGGNEDDLLPLGRALMPSAALLSPRGKVVENGMPRFFRRLEPLVFDQEDLLAQTNELADFVQAAMVEYGRDPRRLVVVGYSNGANTAAAMLLLRPEVIGDAILLRALAPFEPEKLPDLDGHAALILAGQQDQLIPPAESERLAQLLQAAGANVTLSWQPGGHGIGKGDVTAARAWLAERRPSG